MNVNHVVFPKKVFLRVPILLIYLISDLLKVKKYQLAISSLSWATTEQKLTSIFSHIGKVVDVTVIKNMLGESVGDAFITMENRTDAETAAKSINGKEVDGKLIRVVISSTKENQFNKAILASV